MKRFLIGLLVVLGCWGSAHALNVGELKVAIRQQVDDRADPQLRYSDTLLLTFLNEAQRDMVNRSWCLQKTSTQTLSVRTTYYSLPTDLIAIQEVNFKETTSGRMRQFEEKTERALNQENPDYERQAGAPFYYFVRHSTSAATTLEYGVIPVPSSTTATGTAFIDYYSQPTDLTANSDVPLLGFRHLYPYHTALVYYVAGKIKLLEGDAAGGAAYMQLYAQLVQLMVDRLGMMPNYNPGFGGARK